MNKTTTNSVIKNNTSKNLNSLQNKDLFTLNSFKQNNNKITTKAKHGKSSCKLIFFYLKKLK